MLTLNLIIALTALGIAILTLLVKHRRLPFIGRWRELIEPSFDEMAFGRCLGKVNQKLRRRIGRLEALGLLLALTAGNISVNTLVRISSHPDRLHWIPIVPALLCLLYVWQVLVVQNDWTRYRHVLWKVRKRPAVNVAASRSAPDLSTFRPSL